MLLVPTLLCPKAWENMAGGETRRFCTYCKKHVHNLEALSVSERLALLSSPAASICSRYRVAIRRPAKGKKRSYLRHLAKYGAGVALTGTVVLVFWEMHDEAEKQKYYRAAALHGRGRAMPPGFYVEHQTHLLGEAVFVERPKDGKPRGAMSPDPAPPLELTLAPAQIDPPPEP